jgi:CubicO group peptidase (beta-lactamase class C family)
MTNNQQLPRSTPEAQGIASSAILNFVKTVEQQIDALHSFMLLRHGQVVAEGWWSPYAANEPHILFSLSKSFTSTAVGLAVAEGRLTVDDQVIAFFPEETPAEVSNHLAAMQVRHLLAMATGHTEDTTRYLHEQADGNWAKAFLARPVERAPGTHFLYNSGATYMLSAIVQKLTGLTLTDYLRPRLFDPLGIDYAFWESCPRGINTGGWGLNITTESIARFGQLYLQNGQWHGQQLVPVAWIAEATTKQVSNGSKPESDWEQGYGYQFWRCRHNAYRGDGAFGQYCVVLPEQDAVLAITSGIKDMQAPLNIVWAQLLPALTANPLPENPTAQAALTQKLATLALPSGQGAVTSPLAAQASGRCYHFALDGQQGSDPWQPKLEALAFTFGAAGTTVTLRDTIGEHKLCSGYGEWAKGEMMTARRGMQPVAVSGAWTADDTYVMQIYFYHTPFRNTITCRFDGEQVSYHSAMNVGFGPTEQPQLVGRLA